MLFLPQGARRTIDYVKDASICRMAYSCGCQGVARCGEVRRTPLPRTPVNRIVVRDPNSKNIVVDMPLSMLEGSEGVLSARELEILLLSARGLSNGQIASSLHVAEGTVKRHLANVYLKMGVRNREEAAREALLKDWMTVEEVKGPAPGKDGKDGPT